MFVATGPVAVAPVAAVDAADVDVDADADTAAAAANDDEAAEVPV